MNINYAPKPKTRDEIAGFFQIGKNGISSDYFNTLRGISMLGQAINEGGARTDEFKSRMLKSVGSVPSYTAYMHNKGKIDGIGLADFLTEEGKKVVIRLDKIATEIRSLATQDFKTLNMDRIEELYRESEELRT